MPFASSARCSFLSVEAFGLAEPASMRAKVMAFTPASAASDLWVSPARRRAGATKRGESDTSLLSRRERPQC
jgi:hypothetical protein